MRLLLDSCVWGPSADELIEAGHDVVWVGNWLADPGDDAILAAATAAGRILVTLDKDFGEIAIVRGMKHAGIIRLVGISARRQGGACRFVLERHGGSLRKGAIVTVEPGRTRIRLPEG